MKNETVLLTGASSGIGLEMAKSFAADGCSLVLIARNTQSLQSLASELQKAHGTSARILTADLALPETPKHIFDELQKSGVTVDVLVNNAGFGARGQFIDLPLQRQLEMIQVNVMALTHLTGLFLPGMIARKRGGVLNIASTAAFQSGPGMAIYYATKAFVLSFSEAIAEESVGKGIAITALCPGPVKTNFATVASIIAPSYITKHSVSAQSVAQYGYRVFRHGQVVAVPGFRNKFLAFVVRFVPRSSVRKHVKSLNALRPSN